MFSSINEKLYNFFINYDKAFILERKHDLSQQSFYDSKLLDSNLNKGNNKATKVQIYYKVSNFFEYNNEHANSLTLNKSLFEIFELETLRIVSFSDIFTGLISSSSTNLLNNTNDFDTISTNINHSIESNEFNENLYKSAHFLDLPLNSKQEALTTIFKANNYFEICNKDSKDFFNNGICSLMRFENTLDKEKFFYHPVSWSNFINLFEILFFQGLINEEKLDNFFQNIRESVKLKKFNYKLYNKNFKNIKREVYTQTVKKLFTRTDDLSYSVIRTSNKL